MSNLPPEIAPFLTFFRLSGASENGSKGFEMAARVHGLTLIAMKQLNNPFFEEQFLGEDQFVRIFLDGISEAEGIASNKPSDHLLFDFMQSSLGDSYRLNVDPSQHIKLYHQNKAYDLFPFFLMSGGVPYWLMRCRARVITYSDGQNSSFSVDSGQSLFEDLVDGFLEKGWYRAVLKSLENLPEARKKFFENKIYSAHCFLGCELYKEKRYPEAVIEFESAMRIKATMPQLHYNLALSYGRMKSYKTGIHLLNRLNRIRPDQAKTYELLGDFYFHLEEWQRAIGLYDKAIHTASDPAPIVSKRQRLDSKISGEKQNEGRKEDEKEDKFAIQNCIQDLTQEAELSQFQPVIGREKEILQMQEILACQSKKNVLILGEPGVGKTALLYELAYWIVAGKVGSRLLDKKILRLNLGALLAGAKFRGQLEERLLQLIREVKKLNCILFVDDIHQIVAGLGKSGSTETSNFIKPALMNNEIQMIGATNFEEFRTSIEKDSSFLRCFQILRLEEPDHETLMKILRAYRGSLQSYHHVSIQEESLETTLMWVKVLLRERALPDKALDVLDRAAARVSIQGGAAVVKSETILETISEISNISLSRMSISETVHYRNIENLLCRRVVGQPQAVSTVSRVLCTSRLRMNLNPARPKGIFLFVGPTGVGKTELAKAMAEFLFGHEDKIVRIDMSEYMERYSASRLIGTSPGYVGYYDQNQLVDKIRANPYSLILLDEIEKADSQLLNIFLQVFDAGRLTDGKGKIAYFDNATIVMTSNIGTHLFAQNKLGYGADQPEGHVTRSDLLKEVKRFFQPEFLNRIDEIVFFKPLSLAQVRQIAEIKLSSVFEQLQHQGKELILEEEAMLELCRNGYNYEYGARNLERVLRRCLLDRLAEIALTEEWPSIKTITGKWQQNQIVVSSTVQSGLQEVMQPATEEINQGDTESTEFEN